tara:strand:+ start:1179 stop:1469 length:291 start_codon:yes stop_codon:yes gene_type:complete
MTITLNMSAVSKMFDQAEALAKTLPKEAYDYFVDSTPIRSGNARRSTRLRGSTIDANYAYAERLDNGYSRQAPKGMTGPTEKFLQKRIDNLIGKIK